MLKINAEAKFFSEVFTEFKNVGANIEYGSQFGWLVFKTPGKMSYFETLPFFWPDTKELVNKKKCELFKATLFSNYDQFYY